MIDEIKLRLTPAESVDKEKIKNHIADLIKMSANEINDIRITRESIDARQKNVWVELVVKYATGSDKCVPLEYKLAKFRNVNENSPKVIIVGAGPAGLFAALRALELGIKPIVIERGKDVESRLRDIAKIQKEGKIIENSNFCFGEGGAGAYSDGKLFTRSKKRGDVNGILQLLHQHGAKEDILYKAHPHIGSDKLPGIIKNIRQTIISHGGEIHFNTRFKSIIVKDGRAIGITTDNGENFLGPVILATGHSAKDVYEQLEVQGINQEPKGFAIGVRLEHPQEIIDKIRYHSVKGRGEWLPPAEYSLSCQVGGRGVYSFCMCPGGVIVPAASSHGESVVNGMSASARGGRWANSGMVVEIRPEDFPEYQKLGNLGMLHLQKDLENKFFKESNNSLNAPAQRMIDFTDGKLSSSLPRTSYVCGIHPARLDTLLPEFISSRLKDGLKIFGKRNKGFLTNEAVMIGLESRTSSPVRIPRDKATREHPDMPGLYPVGEGAGYAGGIVSAALDGVNSINALHSKLKT